MQTGAQRRRKRYQLNCRIKFCRYHYQGRCRKPSKRTNGGCALSYHFTGDEPKK